jgi:hypothetical protein
MTSEVKTSFLSKSHKHEYVIFTPVITHPPGSLNYFYFVGMIKDFSAEEEPLPSLDDILSLGQNKEEAFKVFCDYILPAVCGRKSNQVKLDEINIHEIATPSDEAFALLLLENAWKRWIHQAANSKDENFPTTNKYSNEGTSAQSAKMYAGWR